jgi:hypothetical protein
LAIYSELTNDPNAWITLIAKAMPASGYAYDTITIYLNFLLPAFIIFCYIPPIFNFVFRIVKDKESGAKE